MSAWFWSLKRKFLHSGKLGISALGWLAELCLDLYCSLSGLVHRSGLMLAPRELKCVPPLLEHSSLEQWVMSSHPSSGFLGHRSSSTGFWGNKTRPLHSTISLSLICRAGPLQEENHQFYKIITLIEKKTTCHIPAHNQETLGRKKWLTLSPPAHSSSG